MPAAKANNLPDSEVYPSNLETVQSILRVADDLHPTHPRISYLCVCGALEELRKIDPLSVLIPGIGPAPMPLWPRPTEGVQASTTCMVRSARCDLLISACPSALALYQVLEHLSKEVQLPPQVLEAHDEVKRFAKIFVPYRIYPNDPYSDDHLSRSTPEMIAFEDLLGVKVFSRLDANNRKIIKKQPLPNPREACPPKTQGHNKSENMITGNTPVGKPSGIGIGGWAEPDIVPPLLVIFWSLLFFCFWSFSRENMEK
ncbi:unnamed protein product [Microthlaspi erraticum]|uniref:Uncharacterized protein n=1 Tax=Microthlaspi erraticum TaxID=1685480 RepID=A0A6D2JD74_9BRAS|nr:unnamed protein product [Microthlaspi erraticum]